MALDYEHMSETLFSVGEATEETETITTPSGYLDWEFCVFHIFPSNNNEITNGQGLFAQKVMKVVKRLGDWSQELWKGDQQEVLVFGIASNVARVELEQSYTF